MAIKMSNPINHPPRSFSLGSWTPRVVAPSHAISVKASAVDKGKTDVSAPNTAKARAAKVTTPKLKRE